jgi:hypothetical protein
MQQVEGGGRGLKLTLPKVWLHSVHQAISSKAVLCGDLCCCIERARLLPHSSPFFAMIAALVATSLAFQAPGRTPSAVHAPRARPPAALLEAASLLADAAALPAEFAQLGLSSAPAIPRFGDALMNIAGTSVLFSAAHSFAPVLKRKIETPDATERVRRYLREDVAASRFGWLQADLRTALPPLEQLTQHPIGLHEGRRVYLCHLDGATAHYQAQVTRGVQPRIEVSDDFTEHYGERVYLCFA